MLDSIYWIYYQVASCQMYYIFINQYPNSLIETSFIMSIKNMLFFFKIVNTLFSLSMIWNAFVDSLITIPLMPS